MKDERMATLVANMVKNVNLYPKSAGFIGSMSEQYAKKGTLSDKQMEYVKKFATGEVPALPKPVDVGSTSVLIGMFTKAKEKLKWPAIKITAGGLPLKVSMAGPNSKYKGKLIVTDGGKYPHNEFYGTIDANGFTATGKADERIKRVVKLLVAEPYKLVSEYGKKIGNCCFCSRDLSDARSVEMGYGPICAGNYGLPWGELISEQCDESIEVGYQAAILKAEQAEMKKAADAKYQMEMA